MIQVRKVKELVVSVENRPGQIARVLGAIAVAGMNVEAYMAHAHEGSGVLRILAEDAEAARERLVKEGCVVETTEVLAVVQKNSIGSEAGIARRLANASIDVQYAYATTAGDGSYLSVIATSDNDAAIKALGA